MKCETPSQARIWYELYDKSFWQERITAAGFREYAKDVPRGEWSMDVDAGPVIAGHGTNGVQSGEAVRVPGKGVPNLRNQRPGDLVVVLVVVLPLDRPIVALCVRDDFVVAPTQLMRLLTFTIEGGDRLLVLVRWCFSPLSHACVRSDLNVVSMR